MPLCRALAGSGHQRLGALWVKEEVAREESLDLDWTGLAPPVSDEAKDGLSAGSEEEEQPAGSGPREDLLDLPDPGSKSYSK